MEKACLPILSLVLGIKSCLEADGLKLFGNGWSKGSSDIRAI